MSKAAKPLTNADFYILLALTDEDRHGLGIAGEVEDRTRGDVQLGPGTLYNAIKRMVAEGLIEPSSARPEPEHDDPRRRYYRITESGRQSLSSGAARLERVMRAVRDKKILPASPRS